MRTGGVAIGSDAYADCRRWLTAGDTGKVARICVEKQQIWAVPVPGLLALRARDLFG